MDPHTARAKKKKTYTVCFKEIRFMLKKYYVELLHFKIEKYLVK